MNTTHVAVDLAKSVFQVAVSHTPGRIHRQRRFSRAGFRRFFADHEPVQGMDGGVRLRAPLGPRAPGSGSPGLPPPSHGRQPVPGRQPAAQNLMTVPGIGVLTATALVAFAGDPHRFRSGRRFAAYLGLTPREHSSGRSRRMGRITKHRNSYLRMMLIHGARSALRAGQIVEKPDDLRRWALELQRRKGYNVAAVALANKLARICWRVWRDDRPFESRRTAV